MHKGNNLLCSVKCVPSVIRFFGLIFFRVKRFYLKIFHFNLGLYCGICDPI